jgi:hypothetical protein
MKLVYIAAISTGLVVALGIALVSPAFLRTRADGGFDGTQVILAFVVQKNNSDDIGDTIRLSEWCQDLSETLDTHKVQAVVFESGIVAESSPECVSSFSDNVDLGSQTFNQVNLTAIEDYTYALQEVRDGKQAIDNVGNVDSKLFRAADGSTNDDIFSLLNRSGIVADFSYEDHYNKYQNGLFIRYPLATIDGDSFTVAKLRAVTESKQNAPVVMIIFEDSIEVGRVGQVIDELKNNANDLSLKFVNASDIIGTDLSPRQAGT